MYDIRFFQETSQLKESLLGGALSHLNPENLFELFESKRSRFPFVFNIETTNHCNMTCIMCPRTSLMTRNLETMDLELFKDIIPQVRTHSQEHLREFDAFIERKYEVRPDAKNENAFYFNVSSRHLTLHGFGEPLIDPLLKERIQFCSSYRVPTYFSCVPANINLNKIEALMDAGTGVIKFSIDALDDDNQKQIRGTNNNFHLSYKKIIEVLKLKQKRDYSTQIVVTLIGLSQTPEALEMHSEFLKLWEQEPVYAYVKSQDNRWLYEADPALKNESHYERQYCEFPWMSLSIMANGSVVPCTQDYDTEIVLGNAKQDSLVDIWNGKTYEEFRLKHLTGLKCSGLKCNERCDQHLVYERKLHPQVHV